MENYFALEPGVDGEMIGRDPRKMSIAELEQLGHGRMPTLKAIRSKCLDCCVGVESEVRWCTALACPLWPYRMGSNPFREKVVVDHARMALLRSRARENLGKKKG